MLRASYSARINPIAEGDRYAFPARQPALFCWTTRPRRIIIKVITRVHQRFCFFFLRLSGAGRQGLARGEENDLHFGGQESLSAEEHADDSGIRSGALRGRTVRERSTESTRSAQSGRGFDPVAG